MNPIITVIIPIYNSAKTILQAVDSVLVQDMETKIILIDDCSTDSLDDVLAPYLKMYKNILYIKNEKNQGVAYSRNKGVALADTDYIAFLDSDDYWSSEKLKEQYAFMIENNAVLSSTARELVDSKGIPTGKVFPIKKNISYTDLLKTNSISCSAVIAKRDVLLEFPMEHEDSHEDYITWLKILKKYKNVYGLNKPYLKYRLSTTSKSGTKIKSAKMTFKAYRYIGLSLPMSIFYFFNYAFNGFAKYNKPIKTQK